jgi:parallel beta-helix repeat protein
VAQAPDPPNVKSFLVLFFQKRTASYCLQRLFLFPRASITLALLFAFNANARTINVRNVAELVAAMHRAAPGDDIVLADGIYSITGKLHADAPGTVSLPITVRSAHPLRATIRSGGLIAFEVTAPYWHFSALDIRGVCADDTGCEHAFHVVGPASGFWLSDSLLADFNAHLKVNADGAHHLPADGMVQNNEFFDSHPRHTNNPVAPVNIDNAIGWVVRGNFIHDFQKDGSGEGSYGAFVKGGSRAPMIEDNRVECALNHPSLGQMVGLSFGAHGMAPQLCPPHWDAATPCDPEVTGGIMRDNVVRNCSDDGIYLNKARDSRILSNTLTDTGGIEFRFPSATGVASGNLMTGTIRGTFGGRFTSGANLTGLTDAQQVAAARRTVPYPGPRR